MAVAFRASASNANPSSNSLTVNIPAGTQNGDIMIAVFEISISISNEINTPSGWTLLDNAASVGPNVASYWRVASAEPASYTWTFSATNAVSGIIASYSGGGSIDTHGAFNRTTSSTSITANSISTAIDGDMLVFVVGCSAAETSYTGPAGFTQRATPSTAGGACLLADMLQTTHGATGSVTTTAASSANTNASLIAIAPGVAATPDTVIIVE